MCCVCYIYVKHSKVHGAYCLGIFQNVDPTTLLGGNYLTSIKIYTGFTLLSIKMLFKFKFVITGIIFRNTLVTYDRNHNKIGFLKTNCSDLRATLNA